MSGYRTSLCAGALLLGMALNAGAADLGRGKKAGPLPPPPEVRHEPVFDWTGLYYGGSIGAGFTNTDHYYDRQNGNNDHGQVWLDSSGFTISGHVGYNHMLPSLWVVGVEAELGWLGISNEKIVIKDDDVLRADTGFFGTLRGRLGYAFGRFMPYVTGGFAFVDIENAGGNPANANRFKTVSEVRPGFVVGGGAEYAFSPNIIGRLEYLYIDTAEYEVRNLENEKMTFDNNFHLVRAGLSYKF
jgi:outer membrane immunogenic protein